jgi:hypothetical protein
MLAGAGMLYYVKRTLHVRTTVICRSIYQVEVPAHCQIFHFLVVIELEELIIVEKLIIEGVSRCLMGHGIGIPLLRQKIFLTKVTLW